MTLKIWWRMWTRCGLARCVERQVVARKTIWEITWKSTSSQVRCPAGSVERCSRTKGLKRPIRRRAEAKNFKEILFFVWKIFDNTQLRCTLKRSTKHSFWYFLCIIVNNFPCARLLFATLQLSDTIIQTTCSAIISKPYQPIWITRSTFHTAQEGPLG